jgi:uncharacterized NAD(P)/FAD-binding protein YdhS
MRAIRKEAHLRNTSGLDWRDVVNELRVHTPEIWQRFSLAERRRFLRHAVVYWDIHRHRLAPTAHKRLSSLIAQGQVETVAGYIQKYQQQGQEVTISVRLRHSGIIRNIKAGSVINCSGPNYNLATQSMPLIVQLLKEGILSQDALKIGLEIDDNYQLIDQQGKSVSDLYYVGPMLKAKYWESIAIPELRKHTLILAKNILAGLH